MRLFRRALESASADAILFRRAMLAKGNGSKKECLHCGRHIRRGIVAHASALQRKSARLSRGLCERTNSRVPASGRIPLSSVGREAQIASISADSASRHTDYQAKSALRGLFWHFVILTSGLCGPKPNLPSTRVSFWRMQIRKRQALPL